MFSQMKPCDLEPWQNDGLSNEGVRVIALTHLDKKPPVPFGSGGCGI